MQSTHLFANIHADHVRLSRPNRSWYQRAGIHRNHKLADLDFKIDKPDFLEELLPFSYDHTYKSSCPILKNKCITAGWIIYNLKTIAIETDIISPACLDLIHHNTLGKLNYTEIAFLSQTLIDEAYHTLLAINGCQIAASNRFLHLTIPAFALSESLQQHAKIQSRFNFSLIRLAYATVSEALISDYLSLLSEHESIQPIFRQMVAIHRADEVVHRNFFPLLLRQYIQQCTVKEKLIFIDGIVEAAKLFTSREWGVWENVLKQIYSNNSDEQCIPICNELYGDPNYDVILPLLDQLGLYNQPGLQQRIQQWLKEENLK